MKTTVPHTALAFIATLMLFLFASCEHKDLCYRHPHVQNVLLVFDWRHISNVPGAMRVFFYPVNNSRRTAPYVFDISSATAAEGTEILVEEGIYHVVSFNIDTENILYRNENILSEFEVYTQERMLTLNARKDNRVVTRSLPLVGTPDWMCRASSEEVRIGHAQDEGPVRIVLTPRPAVSKFICEIRGVKNLQYVKSVVGTLSGVAGSLFMGTGMLPTVSSIVHFDMQIKDNLLTGDFLLFGLHSPLMEADKNILTLYFRTEVGVRSVSFDVSDRIEIEEDKSQYVIKANVIIDADIDLPSPIVSDEGGIAVDAEEWDAIYIDIDMNI